MHIKTDSFIIHLSHYYTSSQFKLKKFQQRPSLKMPQRRDNAGAVCDSDMGMLHQTRKESGNHLLQWPYILVRVQK